MVSKIVLAGILFPVAIYILVAAILLFVLGCALYVCFANFRQYVRKMYRKFKLLYWPEQTFDFLGLPPEIRVIIYRYTLPKDGIYYLTARKTRLYGRSLPKGLNGENVHPPPSLLRLCRLVYQELWPMIYKTCVFYITIYSIRDLLYAWNLLDRYASRTTPSSTDMFSHMSNIRIRVNDLILNIHPLEHSCYEGMIAEISQTDQLWFGPGASLLQDRSQAAMMVGVYHGRGIVSERFDAVSLQEFITSMLGVSVLDKRALIKMLPWYQRHQSRRKSSKSNV
ncbi:unnamed protein product [Aureobasidium mustum]|uniref:Uncharacterized protein n=1 Tax=Aureobasidium mustum TaxID=2773714 RepID=A0A9N8KB37_9PEZI|nr:unnamed protein product [Aureobasidium mustum]